MPGVTYTNVAIVAAAAFLIPLLLGMAPRLRMPAVVVEIVAGIVIGPAVLGWVKVDLPIQILSFLGLAFLLFLAGIEVELDRLRGKVLYLTLGGFAAACVLALGVGEALYEVGLIHAPLLVAIILVATSLGVIIPILKDAGESETAFGQLVIAGGSIADFGAIILLSLFFSQQARSTQAQLALLAGFVVVAAVSTLVIIRAERFSFLSAVLVRLQDTTAQIRVRGAFLLLAIFAALAESLGLEVILGAFMAGAILKLVDRDERMTHEDFHQKLEAVGFGVFIPFFFITSGLKFPLHALFSGASTIALIPLFVLALLLIRGVPALVYRRAITWNQTIIAGLLQATSLPFIVAGTQIGLQLHLLRPATAAALVAAGLVSVLVFPAAALTLMGRTKGRSGDDATGR